MEAAFTLQWVGYYLESPCRPRSTWTGRRATLEAQGWGFAVLYVGEQLWSDTTSAPAGDARCTRRNLTAQRGEADAADAEARAAAEGFANGTVIFLNVERVEQVSDSLAAYVKGWVNRVLSGGRYRAGLYAHERNAGNLHARVVEVNPPLWVARATGFSLEAAPRESGIPGTRIWQGAFNITETHGEHSIRIDANVADSRNPSQR